MVRRNNSQNNDTEDDDNYQEVDPEPAGGWTRPDHTPAGQVIIETGRGNSVNIDAGEPFQATIERIADEANYGGYFRVFLNGEEIVDPTTAPRTLEEGMRVTLTPYDKVGTDDAITYQQEGNILTIRVALSAGVPSKSSGKNLVKASTGGFQAIPGTDLRLNLMVIAPR